MVVAVLALLAAPAAALCVQAANASTTAAPKACSVFTKALASRLIKERPKAIVDGPIVCTYGRSSERAATMKTTLSFTIVRNPSVAAAKAVQRRVEKIAPSKTPPGMTAFAREALSVPKGEATYVYFRQAGGPIVGGFVFLRVGAYTAQLTPQVVAKVGRAFTADDLKAVASQLGANWAKTA
jgi:hypothetical protein